MAKIKSTNSYDEFKLSHFETNRFSLNTQQSEFIESFKELLVDNEAEIDEKTVLCRAQRYYDSDVLIDEKGNKLYDIAVPASKERMYPKSEYVNDGRINPKKIAYFYCSNDENTALAETRPWVKEYMSLGLFETTKKLKLANLMYETKPFYFKGIPEDKVDEYIWNDIAYDFSKPVSRNDDLLEYTLTQRLSEVIKSKGYDGIVYNSLLADGKNICLFDMSNVKFLYSKLFEVKQFNIDFNELPPNTPT